MLANVPTEPTPTRLTIHFKVVKELDTFLVGGVEGRPRGDTCPPLPPWIHLCLVRCGVREGDKEDGSVCLVCEYLFYLFCLYVFKLPCEKDNCFTVLLSLPVLYE